MQKILIATTNKGKLQEIKEYLSDLSVTFVSLQDVGITQDIEEDGKTYEENSQKKALFYAKLSGLPSISDDGGLEIAALGGAPGLRSKRWVEGGEDAIIEKMKQVSKELPDGKRKAQFIASLSFAMPDDRVWSETGTVNAIIAKEPLLKILKGFPYRSFLFIPEIGKYYHESELTEQEKKEYNHRYKALMELKPIIKKVLSLEF